ncbi:MAG: hypothetical protein HQK51_13730 [Oligoflexia bacterium]|nr:hypothetical protein [Oligoflexia bacterium]
MYKTNRELTLDQRDMDLFEYLFSNKVALLHQINRDVFGNIPRVSMYRRLKRLDQNGFLAKQVFMLNSKPYQAISLSFNGFKKYLPKSEKGELRTQIHSDSITHDVQLLDIQNRFKRFEMVKEYFTENQIRSNADYGRIILRDILEEINCDGVVKIKYPKFESYVPIEYELSQKSGKRYADYLMEYYLNPKIFIVLYIAGSEELQKKLLAISKRVGEKFEPKIFFTTYDKFMADSETVTSTNHGGHQMILK